MTIFCLIRAGWHALGDSEWTKGSSAASGHMLKEELFREEGNAGRGLWVGWGGNTVEEIESVHQDCTGRQMEGTKINHRSCSQTHKMQVMSRTCQFSIWYLQHKNNCKISTATCFDVSVIHFTSGNNLLSTLDTLGFRPTQSQMFFITAVYLTLIFFCYCPTVFSGCYCPTSRFTLASSQLSVTNCLMRKISYCSSFLMPSWYFNSWALY